MSTAPSSTRYDRAAALYDKQNATPSWAYRSEEDQVNVNRWEAVEPDEHTLRFEFVLWDLDRDEKLFAADDMAELRYFSNYMPDRVRVEARRTRTMTYVTRWTEGETYPPTPWREQGRKHSVEYIAARKFELAILRERIIMARLAGF